MSKYPASSSLISLLATISAVAGCGVMPAGQDRTISFTVTGFTLPVAMAYTEVPTVSVKVPSIATSEAGAKAFAERLVMQTVFDVLESQGRNALLPEAVISTILNQLSVRTSYEPMNCKMVVSPTDMLNVANSPSCIIVDNTVTGICNVAQGDQACTATVPNMVTINPVPNTHLTISGSLSTTNMIMANWSKAMWQNVVNRAVRMLAWGPFGSHFFSAFAVVD
ncbi:hypothetical protein KIN20_015830 [Parelaphostrongylus tenuis]|uniref:Uncharacterized protein n=1 Tax=Parelaphostrongylus tenuis TaxID=148309 RepID=A0AAD5MFK2_PARTN|nr:hypothetical protein KIN20_015830 [Parelaphostrongylus tenuis]